MLLIADLLLLTGALFMVVAALGVLRMPDFFLRTSATTKAATLGVGLLMSGAALHFADLGLSSRAVAIVVFVGLTTPVAGHMLGRAAYRVGVPLWTGTVTDDLAGRYDHQNHTLAGEPPERERLGG